MSKASGKRRYKARVVVNGEFMDALCVLMRGKGMQHDTLGQRGSTIDDRLCRIYVWCQLYHSVDYGPTTQVWTLVQAKHICDKFGRRGDKRRTEAGQAAGIYESRGRPWAGI